MAGFTVVSTRVEVLGAAATALFTSEDGPLAVGMDTIAGGVLRYAQEHCPREDPTSRYVGRMDPAPLGLRYSGRLHDSLKVVRESEAGGIIWLVGSDLVYAARIELHPRVGGFLRGALTTVANAGRTFSRTGAVGRRAG